MKSTRTGGDAPPTVRTDLTGNANLSALGVGDTIVVSPGSMRSVVSSPTVTYTLYEPRNVTEDAVKKNLSVNRRDLAKIELLKGELFRGDVFRTNIAINLSDPDPNRFDRTVHVLAFNRGEKAFRGDLTIYDFLPPDLVFMGYEPPAKYNDRTSLKSGLSAIPILGFLSLGMDNFSRSNEPVQVVHRVMDNVHQYTFQRLILEPGQAVGFAIKLKFTPPSPEELNELRDEAKPVDSRQDIGIR